MKHEAFNSHTEQIFEQIRKIAKTKGVEYANNHDDRLANFKDIGNEVGCAPELVLWIYLKKHLRSIDSYIKNGLKVQSEETIHGRIFDAIVYLLLFDALIIDRDVDTTQAKKTLDQWASDGAIDLKGFGTK